MTIALPDPLPEDAYTLTLRSGEGADGFADLSFNALDGEFLFTEQCASCHGDFGEAVDRWPVLAGGFDSLTSERPVKTIEPNEAVEAMVITGAEWSASGTEGQAIVVAAWN